MPTDQREPRLREAVRAVLIDPDHRVFLVRFTFPEKEIWATPGGGVEPGESDLEALRRELAEEVGAIDTSAAQVIWTRTHVVPLSGGYDGQRETYYLLRIDHQPLRPTLSEAQLRAEDVTATEWWTLAELAATMESFAPRRLPALVRQLVEQGPPPKPFDVGV